MADLSPMLKQYLETKDKYKDCILFFRLGDFYEMFFDDAILVSKELQLTLTGKQCGLEERAPMCGIPYHAADTYIDKLIEKGYRIAICEQMEDPALAKGLVRRDVIRVVTAGTVTNSKTIDEKSNNFLCCVYRNSGLIGLSFVDITTGDLISTEFDYDKLAVLSELSSYAPREIVCNREFATDNEFIADIKSKLFCNVEILDDEYYDSDFANDLIFKQFNKKADELSVSGFLGSIISLGGLLYYLSQTQMIALPHIDNVQFYSHGKYMDFDYSTRRNLEIVSTMRENKRKGSLLWVLDDTKTSMGARTLKNWLEKPLINVAEIQNRLEAVEELFNNSICRDELQSELSNIRDIERLMGKIVTGSANCRDLVSLGFSLKPIPNIINYLFECNSGMLQNILSMIDPLTDICDLIDRAIKEEPPVTIKEGGIIKAGFDENVDSFNQAMTDGKQWIADIETRERENTGIKNLKIGFNKVFGYYIEVSKSNIPLVPETYYRKQTLVNCERYITSDLKEIESKILTAEDKICALEYSIFCDVKKIIIDANDRIKATALALATLDTLCSLSSIAVKNNYCKPQINSGDYIKIKDGRHPVVEKMLTNSLFVPNDTILSKKERVSIITGPNMSGKSTYMRQLAIITLMAQIGSFVPAKEADIGIVDKIFTRVGASDDLASGQSTFMVEMKEVANILDNATSRSLLILDEIGRGTSTFDGLSIAWAVVEYIADLKKIGAKTLFATHYHELTELEEKVDGVTNYCIAVKKRNDDITFLRKIIKGGADDSYGIEVAKLAGIKNEVIRRAKEIVGSLESLNLHTTDIVKTKITKKTAEIDDEQIDFSADDKNQIIEELKKTDVSTLTPIEAINTLYRLKLKAEEL